MSVEQYDQYRADLLAIRLSSSERFDNAILTLSAGLLALSIAFMKDVVKLPQATFLLLLLASWAFFAVSIIITLISFILTRLAIDRNLDIAKDYYIEGDKDAFHKQKNRADSLGDVLSYVSASCFILGVVLTISFVIINLSKGETLWTAK